MATGTTSAMDMSYWIKFFTEAGIPASDAAHYAVLFTDNRIQRGMLIDLNKEYLIDMGVTRLGDIIGILKYAKIVHAQNAKENALKGARLPITGSSMSPVTRRSTAASRMVDHFLAKEPEAAPMSQQPVPKMASDANNSKKFSVFDRLGADSSDSNTSSKFAVSALSGAQGSVFSRLGGKSALKRPAPDDGTEDTHEGKSPLEYAGVLKFPKVAKQPKLMASKKVTVLDDTVMITTSEQAMATAAAKARKFTLSDVKPLKVQVTSTTPVQKAKVKPTPISVAIDELISAEKKTSIQKPEVTTTTPVIKTQGVLSMDAPTQQTSAKSRLGKKVKTAPASSTTSGFDITGSTVGGIRNRLGPKTSDLSINRKPTHLSKTKLKPVGGVFSRLGKKSDAT